MTRPADWSPLADADPVPGDPAEVALLGRRLQQTAEQIRQDVAWLRSLCTDEFWESDAGQAFRGRVDNTATRLWRAHHRYLEVGQALGDSLNGSGYAGALYQAQSQSVQALTQAQQAWVVMRQALGSVELENQGIIPFAGDPFTFGPALPPLDGAGYPVLMVSPPRAEPGLTVAIGRYNAHAGDLRAAITRLRQAVTTRDAAAQAAAAKILKAIAADGLQDPAGFLAGLEAGWDDIAGWTSHNWARVVADIANVCGWLATGFGLLALVFAFIPGLQPLAAALEGMALTLTGVELICHTILAATGNGPWFDVGLDLLSMAAFGLGRSAIRGADVTVEVAGDLAGTGEIARLGALYGGIRANVSLSDVVISSREAAEQAVDEAAPEALTKLPGKLGRFGKESQADLKPVSPQAVWKALANTPWKTALPGDARGIVATLGKGAGQALHLTSPEITSSLDELREIPGIGTAARVSGVQFADNVIHYSHLWTDTQITAIGADTIDKLNSVLTHFGSQIPGYDQLKEDTRL